MSPGDGDGRPGRGGRGAELGAATGTSVAPTTIGGPAWDADAAPKSCTACGEPKGSRHAEDCFYAPFDRTPAPPKKCTACGHPRGTPHATDCVYAPFDRRPPTAAPSSSGNGHSVIPDAYAAAALHAEVARVAAAIRGTRNDTLNDAAFALGQLVGAGLLDQDTVTAELTDAARVTGLPEGEIARTLRSGLTAGMAQPRIVVLRQRATGGAREAQGDPEGEDGEDVEDAAGYAPLDWHQVWLDTRGERDWLVEPVIERGKATDLYSPPKVGKSLLGLEWAAGLAAGRPVLGNPAGPRLRVLYVDLENPVPDLRERLEAFGYGPDDLDGLVYLSFPALPPLDTPGGGRDLVGLARAHQVDLVVIDTVTQTISGEENSSDTFRAMYRHAIRPLKAAGVAVLRLDHSGKDLARGQRGSSAKSGDADYVWLLTGRAIDLFDLRRTHARTADGADLLTIRRSLDPLRHEVVEDGGQSRATAELVAELDRLGVPATAGRPAAAKALREAGIKVRNSVLAAALRVRNVPIRLSPSDSAENTPRGRPLDCPRPVPESSESAGHSLGDSAGTAGTAQPRSLLDGLSPTVPPPRGDRGQSGRPEDTNQDQPCPVCGWPKGSQGHVAACGAEGAA